MSDTTAQIERLQTSVSQVEQLRSSAAVSISMMALGIAILVGGIAYTAAKVGPLERRAAALREEIAQLEEYALDSRQQVLRADSARAALALAEGQFDSINAGLARLEPSVLTQAGRTQVSSMIARSERAGSTVAAAGENLTDPVPEVVTSQESVEVLVERLFDESSLVRLRAYDAVMAGYSASPELIPALLRYANEHTDNLNGIYNTLVVLNTVPPRQIRNRVHQAEVLAFLDRVEGLGPRIQARARDVRSRIPEVRGTGR